MQQPAAMRAMSEAGGYYIGIDGGGTHTRALLTDGDGRRLGYGTAGPSNPQTAGRETARGNILRSVEQAWEHAGLQRQQATAAFLGMAGVASKTDKALVEELARGIGLADRIGADHDIRTALAGALAGREGIALIAGTGSSCYGRRFDGRSWRAGGWGHLLDDLGGGYWLGVQALSAMTRAYDGRGESTSLAPALMRALELTDMNDMLRLVGEEGLSRAEIASLAPLVLHAADAGDHIAQDILEHGADELGLMALAVAKRLDWHREPVRIALIGGLAMNTAYRAMIADALRSHVPNGMLHEPLLSPAAGAVLLAMELAERQATEKTIAALRRETAEQ